MDMATRTPLRSPAKGPLGITQAQKQALVDNLQQEITQRARKLRGQTGLQCQTLRSRLEMRVNRIPQALRNKNLQELSGSHSAKTRPAPPPPMPVATKTRSGLESEGAQSRSQQTLKRKSDQISTGDDKENVPAQAVLEIPNPKKRTKTALATTDAKITRARNAGPAGILSPKSHNSRTLPHSPIKPVDKSQQTRTLHSAQTVTKPRAPSRQTKRPGTASDVEGRTSEASTTSAGTTIITKPGARKATASKKAAATKTGTVGRKVTATKTEAAAPAAATRTLRKRN